jgi:hypothetical protein
MATLNPMTTVELIQEIRKQAASMSEEERREVAEELIAAGEDLGGGALTVAPGEAEMVERRVHAIRSGSATLVDGEAFFANVRARLHRQR